MLTCASTDTVMVHDAGIIHFRLASTMCHADLQYHSYLHCSAHSIPHSIAMNFSYQCTFKASHFFWSPGCLFAELPTLPSKERRCLVTYSWLRWKIGQCAAVIISGMLIEPRRSKINRWLTSMLGSRKSWSLRSGFVWDRLDSIGPLFRRGKSNSALSGRNVGKGAGRSSHGICSVSGREWNKVAVWFVEDLWYY